MGRKEDGVVGLFESDERWSERKHAASVRILGKKPGQASDAQETFGSKAEKTILRFRLVEDDDEAVDGAR